MNDFKSGEVFNTKLNFPQIYQIELTEKCNLNCPMCINDRIEHKIHAESTLLDTVVNNGYLRNTLYTELQFSGEPTLSPILEYAIDSIHSQNTLVGLSTNLTTINQPGMIEILNKLDCITISVDSYDKETYEKSRFPAKFSAFKDNLEKAVYFLSNPLIQLQLIKTEWTKDLFEKSKEKLTAEYDWLSNVIIREVEDCFVGYHENGEKKVNKQMCLNPFIAVSIKADGTVVPCCFDFFKNLPLGNILKGDNLLDIWNADDTALDYLREAHRFQEGLPNKCKECYARSPITFMNNELIPSIIRYKLGKV